MSYVLLCTGRKLRNSKVAPTGTIHTICKGAHEYGYKIRSLPNPISLVKGLNHGSRMLRHESDQQLQHIHEIVVLRNMKEGD